MAADSKPIIDAATGNIVDVGIVPSPPPEWVVRATTILLLALLMFAPVAFGSVEAWAVLVIQSCATVLFLLWLRLRPLGRIEDAGDRSLAVPLLGILAIGVVQWVLGLTFYRHATALALRMILAYGAVLLAARAVGEFRRERRIIHQGLTIFGFVIALLAILQAFAGNGKLLWLREVHSGAWFFGPYANHSHFAGLMEMLIPLALVPLLARAYDQQQKIIAGFAGVIMIASLLMARSLGGALALGAQLVLLLALAGRKRVLTPSSIALGAGALAVLGFVLYLDRGQSIDRILLLSDPLHQNDVVSRLQIARDSIALWSKHPILGWGLGTFEYAFPGVQKFYSQFYVDHAHNDYLELLAETGIVGFSCLVWFLVRLVRGGLSIGPSWKDSRSRSIRVAFLVGCFGLLVHGLSDFNLHIPANALLFFALAGLAEAKSQDRRRTAEVVEE